jgi:effector-binding domain-containing protein
MLDKPQIVETSTQKTAVVHLTIARSEIRDAMGPGYQELMAALAGQSVAPTGPWFSHHLRMDPEIFDFEISVPVASAITPVGRVTASELPAATVVRTVYHGEYEGLASAWSEFDSWIAVEGLTVGPSLWEVYAIGPESGPDPATWATELNRPLVR